MKKWVGRSCLSLATLAGASALLGQTTGSLSGWVRDAEGRPLPAVGVTARSPSLQGERTAATGADGRFLMPDLPPGEYDVRAALEGFKTAVKSGVLLQIDREITLEFRLTPAFSEEVTVLGTPPILDVTGTAIGTIVEREVFESLPMTRSYL
ncbi:MAG: carboxypeptidase-like regulatory domain-containing protein, partial [Thermoanaerobaculia bacterium]